MVDYFGAVTGIIDAVLYILATALLGGIIAFILLQLQYKYRVRVRELVRGRVVITDDKARRIKDKDGITWWKLRKMKFKVPEPPSESVDITTKGKKIAEAYLSDDGTFLWINDAFNYEDWKLNQKADKAFRPFTTQQKALLVNEYRIAETYKKKKLSDLLAAAIPYIAVVMILAIFMLFFKEAVEPMNAVGDKMAEVSEQQAELMTRIQDIIQDRVTIPPEEPGVTAEDG